eukprot:9292175-Ditylum_brightwellii.AAC.1
MTTHYHWKYCATGCDVKTDKGCNRCHECMCLDPTCWNSYHENLYFGKENLPKMVRSRNNQENSTETEWENSICSDM